jgi:serine/threonine protein kinase
MSSDNTSRDTMPLSTESAAVAAASVRLDLKPPSPPGFEIEKEIGRGGMGIVYSARDLALNRDVAVKVLQPKLDPNGSTAHRFVDEARITGQLQHPGIPAIHQAGVLPDGRPFLAMKLFKGRTLQDLLERRSDPSVERGRYFAVFEADLSGGCVRACPAHHSSRSEAAERDGRQLR